MSQALQDKIDFVLLDGKENIYRITKDTFKSWYELTKENYTIFAKKDASGNFVPYEDVFDNKYLVSELRYTGCYKDLIPAGYNYFNSANGIKYHKEVGNISCIFISKAGNHISIEDLHHQSGSLLKWLISNKFSVECDVRYFICKSTGYVRKDSGCIFDRALESERSYYLNEGIVKETKRLYDAGNIVFRETCIYKEENK